MTKNKNLKWTFDACREEAKKYKYKGDFEKGSGSAYNTAYLKGWLNEFDWLESKNRYGEPPSKEECEKVARKYTMLKDFRENETRVYGLATRNRWLKEYTWLERLSGKNKLTDDECREAAKKYTTLKDFREKDPKAYHHALYHLLMKEFSWLKKMPKGRTKATTIPLEQKEK